MNITLNNREEHIAGREEMSVKELLEYKNYTFKFLVVRINGRAVKPSEYESAVISNGDEVQVIHLISGG
ncbi:MAG: sulfur carrier protein ThiS [Bacteroidales bacterium]|nr:sulfur carrier protein ThiS [Bacteroidales bacterium]